MIVDWPKERNHIGMVVKSLQPKIAWYLISVHFTNFRSLILTLSSMEEGMTWGLWYDFSPSNPKGKKPAWGWKLGDANAISFAN